MFLLDYAGLGLSGLRCRVEEKVVPSTEKPAATISFKEDRSYLNAQYYLPPTDPPSVPTIYTAQPLADQTMVSRTKGRVFLCSAVFGQAWYCFRFSAPAMRSPRGH